VRPPVLDWRRAPLSGTSNWELGTAVQWFAKANDDLPTEHQVALARAVASTARRSTYWRLSEYSLDDDHKGITGS
jgi:hypothetical protein